MLIANLFLREIWKKFHLKSLGNTVLQAFSSLSSSVTQHNGVISLKSNSLVPSTKIV